MNDGRPLRPLSIYLVAGEASGDALGAALARALVGATGNRLKLAGVGGRAMAAAGVHSLFAIDDLSIIGLSGLAQRLPTILRRIRETADDVIAAQPDVLVIIDSPDFTHRVARRVRARAPAIPIVDYVSPTVWAWRPWRARSMRAYVDCVLAILPFEPAVYVKLGGPPCLYVGHPLIDHFAELRPNTEEAERRRATPPQVLVLPGSRSSEIRRLLAIFGAAIARVATSAERIEFVLPTMPYLLPKVQEEVARWPAAPRIVVEPAEKWAAFRTARAALAASGTVTLELALAGVPMVAAYRVPLIEEVVMRLHSPLHSVILTNIILGENVVPEFLQRDCTPDRLAEALLPLLADTPQRERQVAAFARLDQIMALDSSPGGRSAEAVLEIARRGRIQALAAPSL